MLGIIQRLRFLFLFFVILLFCFLKAVEIKEGWFLFQDIVFLLLMLTSLVIIGHKEKWLVMIVAIVILMEVIFLLLPTIMPGTQINSIRTLVASLFFLTMTGVSIYFTLLDKTISVTTLFGSLCAYLFMGLFFSYLYIFWEVSFPGSFQDLNANQQSSVIYFSFVVLTTLGLGDIYPLTPLSQTTVWFESYVGQCYLAVIMGQLVGRYVAEHVGKRS